MKNTKKILSVVLAVVMALSVFAIAAVAHTYTPGAEVAGATNIKYEVSQVPSITGQSGDTYTAVDNDIYAVTVYVNVPSGAGLYSIQVPIQYDKTKFAPMMLIDSGDLYVGDDDFSTYDIVDVDFYTLPARYLDSKSYDNAGNETTSKLKIKCLGNTHADAGSITSEVKFSGPSQSNYASWKGSLDGTQYGFTYAFIDLIMTGKEKAAYLNTINGKLVNDQYLELVTVYYKRLDGVAEDACYGAQFGCANPGEFGTDILCKNAVMGSGNGAGSVPTGADNSGACVVNYINAAVEAAIKPLAENTSTGPKSQQIMFNLAAGASAPITAADVDSVDYRFVVQFSRTAFPINTTDGYSTFTTTIDEVGFVMTRTDSGVTASQIKALSAADVAALSKDSGDIRKCETKKISTDAAGEANFTFAGRIKGIAVNAGVVAGEYIAVPYIIDNGVVQFGTEMTSDVQGRYDAYIGSFVAKTNA